MKKLVILGAGTAGTIMLNKLAPVLDRDAWHITIVDQHETHYYQPGFLFIPFGIYTRRDVIKPKRDFFPAGTHVVVSAIDKIEPDKKRVLLSNNMVPPYDFLIIATGAEIQRPRPGRGGRPRQLAPGNDPMLSGLPGPNPTAPPEIAQLAFLIGRWRGEARGRQPDGSFIEFPITRWGRSVLDAPASHREACPATRSPTSRPAVSSGPPSCRAMASRVGPS